MSPDIAKLCKKHCGAVAVSWYRSAYTLNAIKTLLEAGVKTNIHYVLTKDSIAEALYNLEAQKFPHGINAVVFLLHKPIGLGTAKKMVTLDNSEFQEFIKYISTQKLHYKIGFDSCTIPALINNLGDIDPDSLDTCEGARWSAYITANMKMLPCSFDNQKQRWAVDLRKYSIKEAWDSDVFENFRKHFKSACPNCSKRSVCMGGCPITPEVVLCRNVVALEQ
jgi:radical SAM protein with 4Fe4S-binding SPASM domain